MLITAARNAREVYWHEERQIVMNDVFSTCTGGKERRFVHEE
jgi:hypothetical protein